MKTSTYKTLTYVILALCAICVVMFFSGRKQLSLVIYNPIQNATMQVDVKKGDSFAKHVVTQELDGYDFVGYYTSGDFETAIDTNSKITTNTTITVGYAKTVIEYQDYINNVVGINYVGQLNNHVFQKLLNSQYKYLNFSSAIVVSENLEFAGVNTTLETLILPGANISGINSFTSLKTIKTSGTTTLKNCFNNCQSLTDIDLSGTVSFINSFNNCCFNKIKIPAQLSSFAYSFVNTPIAEISSDSATFFVESGVLYNVDENECVAKKAVADLEYVNLNSNTTKVDEYAFYYHEKIAELKINSKLDYIGKNAFAQSSLQRLAIEQNNVLEIDDYAFYNCHKLAELNFGRGIEKIGEFAFYNSAAKTLSFDKSVLSQVGDYAFSNCKSLTEVVFGDRQLLMGDGIFSGCESLKKITNLSTLNLPNSMFENCESLSDFINLSSVENVGNYAFYNCKALSNLTSLINIKTAGIGAFQNCSGLVSVQFNNLKNLSENMFLNCTNLENISCYSSIESFNASAFDECYNIKNINMSGVNILCENNVVFNADKTQILYCASNLDSTSFTVPSSVEEINTKSLSQCKNIKEFKTLSDNFYVEDGVLYSADKSQLLSYPQAKEKTSFIVPSFVTHLSSYAFVKCTNLTQLKIGENIQTIDNACLWQNLNLTSLSLKFIGESLNNLSNGFLGWIFGAKSYNQNEIFVPNSLKEVIITSQEEFIANSFYGCMNINVVKLNNSGKISDQMFYGCVSLQTLTMSTKLVSIGADAFYGCLNLINLNFVYNADNNELSIDENAFSNTPNWIVVTVYNNSIISPDELAVFKKSFGEKRYYITWKTDVL